MSDRHNIVDNFVGAWSLVDWTATAPDGSVTHPYGEQPGGRIMYDASGGMAAHLMRRERTSFASDNRHEAGADEQQAAYREYVSYYGIFSVQETVGTVTHHVGGSTFPGWIGTDLVRTYKFSDDRLTLSLLRPDGTRHALVWLRMTQPNTDS